MARPVIWLRDWRAGDESAFTRSAVFDGEREAMGWDWSQGPPGQTWTLERDDGVIGVGGGRLMNHVWECWASLAQVQARDWPALVGAAQEVILRMIAMSNGRAWALAAWCRPRRAPLLVAGRLGFDVVGSAEDAELGVYLRLERRIV